jgi:hypothetical protein
MGLALTRHGLAQIGRLEGTVRLVAEAALNGGPSVRSTVVLST